jgi:pimeloyl-ACP methyl ester carboxylesterase
MKFSVYTVLLILMAATFSGCRSEKNGVIQETIHVERGESRTVAHLHGNLASNVFILVLHGGPGGTGLEYRSGSYAASMEDDYVMVYIDQTKQGMSRDKSGETLSIQKVSEDIEAVRAVIKDRFGSDSKLFLFGHSWGGLLGTYHLLQNDNQNEYEGWIEASGAHDIPLLNRSSVAMFKRVAQEQIAADNSTDQWTELLNWANGIDTNQITNDQGGEINQNGFKAEGLLADDGVINSGSSDGSVFSFLSSPTNPLTAWVSGNQASNELLDEVEKAALTNRLHQITIPTLLLWGQFDFVVTPELGTSALKKLGAADKSLIIFERSGHSPMDAEAHLFILHFKDFIEKHR